MRRRRSWRLLPPLAGTSAWRFKSWDDILDVTQTSEKLGKSAGKDLAAQKTTLSFRDRSRSFSQGGRPAYRSRPRRPASFWKNPRCPPSRNRRLPAPARALAQRPALPGRAKSLRRFRSEISRRRDREMWQSSHRRSITVLLSCRSHETDEEESDDESE